MVFMSWQLLGMKDYPFILHGTDCDGSFLFSRPDLIDPALLRPGRLDKSLLCGMPNLEERLDVCALPPFLLLLLNN